LDERKLIEDKIQSLLPSLFSRVESKREEAFRALCLYLEDRDIDYTYDALMRRGDALGMHWLIRYLVEIERPRGFEKILLLAENENEAVRVSRSILPSKALR